MLYYVPGHSPPHSPPWIPPPFNARTGYVNNYGLQVQHQSLNQLGQGNKKCWKIRIGAIGKEQFSEKVKKCLFCVTIK